MFLKKMSEKDEFIFINKGNMPQDDHAHHHLLIASIPSHISSLFTFIFPRSSSPAIAISHHHKPK
jgi:hypothetical protein